MLSYYSASINEFVVRTRPTGSGDTNFELYLEDMLTHESSSYDLSGSFSYNPYESIMTFSTSLDDSRTGQEFRAELIGNASGSIWYGSLQVFGSQSIDKPNYTTQNEEFISNVTDNDYIVM